MAETFGRIGQRCQSPSAPSNASATLVFIEIYGPARTHPESLPRAARVLHTKRRRRERGCSASRRLGSSRKTRGAGLRRVAHLHAIDGNRDLGLHAHAELADLLHPEIRVVEAELGLFDVV